MRRPDDQAYGTFLQEEMILDVSAGILRVIAGLPPISRLRVLAFLHLLDRPEALRTCLDVEPSGELRLTLTAAAARSNHPTH